MENFNYVPRGWRCPQCGRVYSPSTSMCFYCGGNQTVTITATGITPPSATPIAVNWPVETNIEDYPYDIHNPSNKIDSDIFKVHFDNIISF